MAPGDRKTPIADAALDYPASVVARGEADAHRTTARIDAADLGRLIDRTRRTGATKRENLSAAIVLAARAGVKEAPAPRRGRALPVIAGLGILVGAAALWFSSNPLRGAPQSVAPAPASAATVSGTASAPAASAPEPPGLPAANPAEGRAREALERLRSGLGECIRRGIHGLPGSSPAVPATLGALKGGPYVATAGDWKTPVWSCAHFQVDEPMPFQVQWQLVKPMVEGMGVAWIDADGDGVADRALGFTITLGARGEPRLGEIGPVGASRPVLPIR
jgi:hypothetical protein